MDLTSEELKRAFSAALQESGRSILNTKDIEQSLEYFDKQIKRNTNSAGGLLTEMLTGKRKYKDLNNVIESINDQLEEFGDKLTQEQLARLLEQKKEAEQSRRVTAVQQLAIDGLIGFSKTVGNVAGIAGRSLGGFVSGVQGGASAFTLAGGIMEGAIDAAHTGVTAAAAGIGAVGATAMMSTNPYVKGLGVAASVAAPLISGLGNAAASVGKFIVNYLVKEMEGLVTAFSTTSSAGAMFANGMTGMFESSLAAGLTVKQFSEVLKTNSESIGATGLSMSEGAKKIGGVLTAGGNAMRRELLNLGYSFEEQAGLVADVMRDMTQGRGPLRVSNEAVAEQTRKYAENLRIITDITGEDAKKKMAQVREQANQLAFQQKLASKTPEQQADILRAMGNMSELQRKNFMDMVNFGTVVNEQGAVAQAASRGLAAEVNETYRAYLNNTLDDTRAREITGKYNEQIRSELLHSNAIIGIAQAQAAGLGGLVGDLGKALGDELKFQKTHTKEAIDTATEATKGQKQATDDLTFETTNAALVLQDLSLQLQEISMNNLGRVASITGLIIQELGKQLDNLKEMNMPSLWDDIKNEALKYGEIGLGVGLTTGLITGGPAAGVAGAGIGGISAAVGGAVLGAYRHMTRPPAAPGAGSNQSGAPGRAAPNYVPPVPITNGQQPVIPQSLGVNGRQGSGQIDPKLQELLDKIAQNPMFAGATITGLNDADVFPQHSAPDPHGLGKAVDFRFPGYDRRLSDQYAAELKKMGFNSVLDENIHYSPNRTGAHMHAALANGGIVDPSSNGADLTVAEGGQRELVTPLVNGMLPGMQALLDKVDKMIDILDDHKDISEKHLWASA